MLLHEDSLFLFVPLRAYLTFDRISSERSFVKAGGIDLSFLITRYDI